MDLPSRTIEAATRQTLGRQRIEIAIGKIRLRVSVDGTVTLFQEQGIS
jgi:hypothetical protein